MRVRLVGLFSCHADEAVRFAYLLTLDRGVAQDLTRRAFLRAVRRFRDLGPPESFPYYLRRTILNLSRRHVRWQRIQRLPSPSDRDLGRASAGHSVEDGDELWRVLQTLPHRRRAALVLRLYDDLSEREAADFLGCSVGAVKSLVSSGMEYVRAHYRRDDPARNLEGELRRVLRTRAAAVTAPPAMREAVLACARSRRRFLIATTGMLTVTIPVVAILGFGAPDPMGRKHRSMGSVTDPVVLLAERSGSLRFKLRGFFASTGEACYDGSYVTKS